MLAKASLAYKLSMDKNKKAFTIVELVVSLFISVILLWWIFYFLTDTILWISRSSSQSQFLKDFYSFTTILDVGEMMLLFDNAPWEFDVWILRDPSATSWILIGVVDADTKMLSSTWAANIYNKNYLGYRSLSETELNTIRTNPSVVYDYTFFPDKLFYNFHLRDFQLQEYNYWATMDMNLFIFTDFQDALDWENWENISQEEIYEYSIVF